VSIVDMDIRHANRVNSRNTMALPGGHTVNIVLVITVLLLLLLLLEVSHFVQR